MRIAITGANGFVGSNLYKYFLAAGHEVSALVRPTASSAQLPQSASLVKVDYSDPASLYQALSGCDALIHNAGKTKALNYSEMLKANLGITQHIVQAVNSLDHRIHLLYLSSQAVAGPSIKGKLLSESDSPHPITSYGKSKLEAEKHIQNSCRQPWTIIRPCSVYGCGDKDFLTLFRMVQRGLAVRLGRQERPLNMIHVEQLASFLELCISNPAAYNQVFFATDTQRYTQSDITSAIAQAMDKHPLQIVLPEYLVRLAFISGDLIGRLLKRETILNREKMKEILADGWLADPAKARELLGWQPQPNLTANIRNTALCYKKLGWL